MLGAQRVGQSNIVERRSEEIRPLGDRPTDGDAARTATFSSEMRRRCELVIDEVLPRSDEVSPGVVLGEQLAGEMPSLAVFTATPHVRNRVDGALLEPREQYLIEERDERDAISPI